METIEIRYFCNGEEWASRSRRWVPRVGDEVKFDKKKIFTVARVVWIESGERPHVAIDLEPIK